MIHFITCFCAAFIHKYPKAQKDCQVISNFLSFWDLRLQKLLKNVGGIDPWGQFHQFFTSSFYSDHKKSSCKVFFALLGSAHIKAARKMLVKLTPGVNFINVLRTAFTLVDPKRVKKIQLSHMYLLTLAGSASVKAVRRTLMKLSPGVNFINYSSTTSVKAVRRTLMKLSPGFVFR